MEQEIEEVSALLSRRAEIPRGSWTTDRVGRLVTGGFVMIFLLSAYIQDGFSGNAFTWLAAGVGVNLFVTALIGWCPFHELFKRMGVKDREEVFAEYLRSHSQELTPPAQANALRSWAPCNRALESSPIHEKEEASEYNLMIRKHGWLLNKPFVDMVSAEHKDLSHAGVLDLGTGPGWIPIQLALRHPHWKFWAVDVSEDMLNLGRRHAKEHGVEDRIHFVLASVDDVPFADGSFDLAISHFALHHMEQPETMMREAARVVGPQGRVMIKDLCRVSRLKAAVLLSFSKWILRYSPAQMKMYRESIYAAFTAEEVNRALQRSPLATATVRGFRGLDYIISFRPKILSNGFSPIRRSSLLSNKVLEAETS